MVYKPVHLNLTKAQIHAAAKSKPIRVKFDQINNGPHVILLHPMTHKALANAYSKRKGITFILSPGEVQATKMSDIQGTGMFDWLKKGFNWVKNHWSDIKPVVSSVLDIGAPILASSIPQAGPAILASRQTLKKLTGVGVKGKMIQVTNPGSGLYL